MSKPDKDIQTQQQTNITAGQYATDAEIGNKILAHQIQRYLKGITHNAYTTFIPGMQGWFHI